MNGSVAYAQGFEHGFLIAGIVHITVGHIGTGFRLNQVKFRHADHRYIVDLVLIRIFAAGAVHFQTRSLLAFFVNVFADVIRAVVEQILPYRLAYGGAVGVEHIVDGVGRQIVRSRKVDGQDIFFGRGADGAVLFKKFLTVAHQVFLRTLRQVVQRVLRRIKGCVEGFLVIFIIALFQEEASL